MLQRRRHQLLLAAVVGAALGALSFLGDGRLGGRAFVLVGNLASPWGLAAFGVGRFSKSARGGALAGGVTLLAGVVVYYLLGASVGYVVNAGNVVWIAVAVLVGPVLGLAGGVVASGGGRSRLAAAAAPSVMLMAEATFVLIERRVWLWNLAREPHRIIDLAVIAVMIALALTLPVWLVRERHRLRLVYPAIVLGGLAGAGGLALLYEILLRVTRFA